MAGMVHNGAIEALKRELQALSVEERRLYEALEIKRREMTTTQALLQAKSREAEKMRQAIKVLEDSNHEP